ncbi:coatomer WD associated region-domain-containing protein [Phellopilus nigrolimitatus]|nr:coatomer WD associated region-domain-containing protein [Phellopilus nigrolimitatus]
MLPHANNIVFGFDEGVVIVKPGCDEPALSMAAVDVETPEGQRVHFPAISPLTTASEILPPIPKEQRDKVARFLKPEVKNLRELALEVTTDPDHKFDLSLQLDDLDAALEIARTIPNTDAETKWKAAGLVKLAVQAEEKRQNNLAFASRLQLGDTETCVFHVLA